MILSVTPVSVEHLWQKVGIHAMASRKRRIWTGTKYRNSIRVDNGETIRLGAGERTKRAKRKVEHDAFGIGDNTAIPTKHEWIKNLELVVNHK